MFKPLVSDDVNKAQKGIYTRTLSRPLKDKLLHEVERSTMHAMTEDTRLEAFSLMICEMCLCLVSLVL